MSLFAHQLVALLIKRDCECVLYIPFIGWRPLEIVCITKRFVPYADRKVIRRAARGWVDNFSSRFRHIDHDVDPNLAACVAIITSQEGTCRK